MAERLSALERAKQERYSQRQARRSLYIKLGFSVSAFALFTFALVKLADSLRTDLPDNSALPKSELSSPELTATELPKIETGKFNNLSFEQLFKQYHDDYKSGIGRQALLVWSEQRAQTVLAHIESASNQFAAGEIAKATEAMRQALQIAEELKQQESSESQRIKNSVVRAFEGGDIRAMRQAVDALANVNPEDSQLKALRKNLELLPELNELRASLQKYASENRPKLELETLQRIAALTELSAPQSERLAQLNQRFASIKFENLVAQTKQLIAQQRFQAAAENIQKLKGLRRDSQVIRQLLTGLETAQQSRNFNDAMRLAKKAQKDEKWKAAIANFRRALAAAPGDSEATEGLTLSTDVSDAINKHQELLLDPLRVADSEVNEYATKVVNQSDGLLGESKVLADLNAKLEEILSLAERERSVFIKSDGKTTIKVQGVGFVQPTLGKTIQLKPGVYSLFANCKNRKEVVRRLVVPLNDETVSIEVGCGEQI